ncbi:MAG: serine phosphatase RsbU (regulator of sigma subunit) [Kiritimatiellia bacterium]|jgi:serine phosphatase RsbU (regulator of sigma subunit)
MLTQNTRRVTHFTVDFHCHVKGRLPKFTSIRIPVFPTPFFGTYIMAAGGNKINSFVFFFVFLPLFAVLAVYNAQLFQRSYTQKSDGVVTFRKTAVQTFENELNSSITFVGSLGYMPAVSKILGGSGSARDKLSKSEWAFDEWFIQLSRSPDKTTEVDFEAIMKNDITLAMDRVRVEHPEIANFQLTDNIGTMIASSIRPKTKNARNEDWWKKALKAKGKPYLDGMYENGSIFVHYSIWNSAGPNVAPVGVIRVEVKVDRVVQRIQADQFGIDAAIIVMGAKENPEKYFTAGSKTTLDSHSVPLMQYINEYGREKGWKSGIHFSRDILHSFTLSQNIRLLAMKEGPLINFKDFMPVMISSLLSLAALGFVTFMAKITGTKMESANRENIQAGNWVLHRARGDSVKEATNTKIGKTLESWMSDLRRSIVENMEVTQFESERDLHLAREFQMSYLDRPYPRIPEVHVPGRLKLSFYHYYKPAMALGGDFFDVIKLGPETAGVLIADVMGHGTRSALITSNIRMIMSELHSQGRNARNFLREMNRNFCSMLEHIEIQHPIFCSAFYFVVDTTARAATFSTAGHPAPFHLKRALNHVERLQVATPHGTALGIVKDEDYTGGSCRLAAGDVLIFFTDGVYEAFDSHGNEFGLIRLDKTIRKLMHNSMEGLVDGIVNQINDFTAGEPLRDDICILALEVTE